MRRSWESQTPKNEAKTDLTKFKRYRKVTQVQKTNHNSSNMYFPTTNVLSIIALVAGVHSSKALRGGGGRAEGGRPGAKGGPGGGPFANSTEFVNITCTGAIDFSCDPPRGDEEGVFVCRTWTNEETDVTKRNPRCIPTDRAIEGVDECGCCGTDCPVPCDTCPCEARNGRVGAYVLVADDDTPVCVHAHAAMMMVYRDDEVSCLADCSLVD